MIHALNRFSWPLTALKTAKDNYSSHGLHHLIVVSDLFLMILAVSIDVDPINDGIRLESKSRDKEKDGPFTDQSGSIPMTDPYVNGRLMLTFTINKNPRFVSINLPLTYANMNGVFVDGKCYHTWHTYGSVMGLFLASQFANDCVYGR